MPNIPATWRATQTVNAITAGIQSRPRITQLTNGNIVVVWATSDAGGTAFVARIFDAAGNPISGELFRQYLTPDDNFTFPDVVAGADGTFVTSYMNGATTAVFLNTWNAVGDPVGNGGAIESSANGQPDFANPVMAWSNANRVLTVYEQLSPTGSSIVGQIHTPGNAGSSTRLPLLDFAGGVVDPAVAANRLNGNFMIVATHLQAGDSRVVLRVINPTNGGTISGPFEVNGTGSNGRTDDQASVAPVGNGFVIAWRSTDGTDSNIQFRIVGGNGSENFAGTISVGATDKFANPTVIPLPDFSFIVTYDDELNHTQQAAHFTGPGTIFPGTLLGTFAYAPTGSDADAVALLDGRFATVWTDAATGEISLQILDARDAPNAAGSDGVVAGTVGDDVIAGGARYTVGGAGNDEIGLAYAGSALPGADGGEGIDTLVFANQTNNIMVDLAAGLARFEWQSGGTTFQTRQFATNFENIRYAGTATVDASGTNGANVITTGSGIDLLNGLGGNDLLDGGGGADRMLGGTGDDGYIVDAFGDEVIEAAGEGNDVVYAQASYQLGGGQSVETLAARDNSLTVAMDLFGNELANVIFGNNGANFLDGAAGADIMTGFGGNDTYAVDNAGDVVIEQVGGGNDAIFTTFSYVLGLGMSVEILASRDNSQTTAMNLFGNELANIIFGNNGANFIDGGTGADIMTGFGGDDTYAVDNAGDVVVENPGGGNDAIYTTFSYVLGLGMSVEVLASRDNSQTTAMNLFGNELDNFIFGNNGANFLDGGTGADTMTGFGGDDTYVVDNANDRVVEDPGGGSDSLYTNLSYVLAAGHSLETLAARDNSLTVALNLTGNELANNVLGNNGANRLDGGAGADVLVGFGSADIFAFTTAAAIGNADYIADFVSGTDKLGLDDAVFQGIGTPGAFTAANFVTGTAAADANDRIIYNAANGQLLYDADGSGAGAAILLATLQGNPALTASDFMVI